MKCPKCKFISSNKRDICPECFLDLRPHKKALGLPIAKPNASFEELRAEIEQTSPRSQHAAPAESTEDAPVQPEQRKSGGWLSRLLGAKAPAATAQPAPESLPSAVSVSPEPPVQQPPVEQRPDQIPSEDTSKQAEPQPASTSTTPEESAASPAAATDAGNAALESDEGDDDLWKNFIKETQDLIEEEEAFSSKDKFDAEKLEPGEVEPIASSPVSDLNAGKEVDEDSLFPESLLTRPTVEPGQPTAPHEEPANEDEALFSPASESVETPPQEKEAAKEEVLESADEPLFPTTGKAVSPQLPADTAFAGETAAAAPVDAVSEAPPSDLPLFNSAQAATAEQAAPAAEAAEQQQPDGEASAPADSDEPLFEPPAGKEPQSQPEAPIQVAPEVMEFDESDDELLEKQLDSLIGDLVLDVAPVKTEKKSAAPTAGPEKLVLDDEDLEISFEFDFEDESQEGGQKGGETRSAASAQQSETPRAVLDDLLNAFNDISSGTTQVAITRPAEEPGSAEAGAPLPEAPQPIDRAKLSTGEKLRYFSEQLQIPQEQLLEEFTEIIAEYYNLSPESLPKKEVLNALERELDAEIKKLSDEGASFLSVDQQKDRDKAEELAASVKELESELDHELNALEQEGFSVHQAGEPAGKDNGESLGASELESIISLAQNEQPEQPESFLGGTLEDSPEDLEKIEAEIFAALEALDTATPTPAEAGPSTHEPPAADSAAEERQSPQVSSGADDPLWASVDRELDSGPQDNEIVFSAAELSSFRPNKATALFFDEVQDELENPDRKREYVSSAPSSEKRAIDNIELQSAFSRFEQDKVRYAAMQKRQAENDKTAFLDPFQMGLLAPAPRWRRLAALIIDVLVSATSAFVFTLGFVPRYISAKVLHFQPLTAQDVVPYLGTWAGLALFIWIFLAAVQTASRGQTNGQGMFRIFVVEQDGDAPGISASLLRSMCTITTLLTLGLGMLPILGRKGRSLHDYLAGTYVVRAKI